MKRFFFAFLAVLSITACRSQPSPSGSITNQSQSENTVPPSGFSEKPKLVVGIVIDQFKPDYLSRFAHQFGEGGFVRLISEGFHNRNTHYNYVPTVTGPGHASVYTGTTPAAHGVVGNNWYSRELGRDVYCAEDTLASPVGSDSDAGKMSSRNLLSTTITDELKFSTNQQAKVVGLAIKDRGAAFPAGHIPDGAYWFDKKYGKFISSTYYMDKLPAWMEEFNSRRLPQQYMDSTWHTLLSLESYHGPDDSPYEAIFKGKEKATFPYNLGELKNANGNYNLLTFTPFANTIVTELAKDAVRGEQLGADEVTDFLALSYSSTDILGHSFGSRSVEVQDMYLRLDRDIEDLLNFLDREVGEGEYLVFVTADHAAAEVSQYLTDLKVPAGYFSQRRSTEGAAAFLKDQFGEEGLIEYATNLQFYLNHQLVKDKKLSLQEVQEALMTYLRDLEGVAAVYSASSLQKESYSGGVAELLQNGYYYKRSGDVFMVLDPAWMDYGIVGTTHGSSYNYDTHVPLIWYGWGIKSGSSVKRQTIADIAPSLSFLLNINLPNGSTGTPIVELFQIRE